MSFAVEEFELHPAHEALESLAKTLGSSLGGANERDDESRVEAFGRFDHILLFTRNRLEAADPVLVPRNVLDAIGTIAQGANTELVAFQSTSNEGHFSNAVNHFDNLIVHADQFPFPASTKEAKALAATLKSARMSAKDRLGNVSQQIDSVQAELESFSDQATQLSGSLDGQVTRIDELVADQKLKFVEQELTRGAQFNTFMEEQAESGQNFVDALGLYKEQAESLLSAIGITGQTAAYGQFADRERKSALVWNSATVVLLFGLIAVALLVILPQLGGAFAWNTFAGRVFAGLTIAIAASFTGRLGAQHQQREDYFRGMQLRIAALDPYLALLDDEQKKQIKIDLAPELFEKPPFMTGKNIRDDDLTKEAVRWIISNAKPTE